MEIDKLSAVLATRITPRQLAIFMAIYECRNVVAAAGRVALSQSTLSKSLSAMEQALEQKLFVRLPRGVKPTAAGDVLYRHGKLVLSQHRQAAEELARLASPDAGQITLACGSAWDSLIARVVSQFKAGHPGTLVRIRFLADAALIDALHRAEVDMIFTRLFPEWQHAALVQEAMFLDPNTLLVTPGHPALRIPDLQLEDLLGYPWLLPLPNAIVRRNWDRMFFRRGLPLPENVIECSSMLLARSLLLELDEVITMPPMSAFRHEIEQGLFRQLDLRPIDSQIPVGFMYRQDSMNSEVIVAFKSAIDRAVEAHA